SIETQQHNTQMLPMTGRSERWDGFWGRKIRGRKMTLRVAGVAGTSPNVSPTQFKPVGAIRIAIAIGIAVELRL
ncbi:MAG: hypothetical protein ACI8W8_003296, partial [Rhodothermales bacterium]